MKLSLNWLDSYFVEKPDWSHILDQLTMSGIELEEIKPVAPEFSQIVVAQVVECEKHPAADKLTICKVNVGAKDLVQIVCGASNVKVGVKVPCAMVGAILPDGLTIASREMRGVASTGMLCSGSEIGCDDGVDGLLILSPDAPIGESIRDYLGLDDQIVEFKITPNRGDCLSVFGILREIKALIKCELKGNDHVATVSELDNQIVVNVEAIDACPNYVGLIIKDVNNHVSLPNWITTRLSRSGVRLISPIVDIVNYVMLERGQPLHAFDLDKIGSKVNVRFAKENEIIELLDGKTANLKPSSLIIADANNIPAAIAGVMGGQHSGVTEATTNIMLESAFFTPQVIAGTAKLYGVSSDAAYRFERGVDPKLQVPVAEYAASLITKFCGGKVGKIKQVNSISSNNNVINLTYAQVNNLIGASISPNMIEQILIDLGFDIIEKNEFELKIAVPSFRFDIKIYQDIIEEIARVYGYDNIKPVMPTALSIIKSTSSDYSKTNIYKTRLVDLGYSEIIGYAFLEEKFEKQFGVKSITPVTLQNPIAGLAVMRTSLVADLIKALLYNINRGAKSVRLFESAKVFHGESGLDQKPKLSGLLYGPIQILGWANEKREVDFFDLKEHVLLLLSGIDNLEFRPYVCENQVFHTGRCAKIYMNDLEIGILGQLHPKLTQEYDFSNGPYIFELDLAVLNKQSEGFHINPINKFPKVERDLSFVVKDDLAVGDILHLINNSSIKWLYNCRIVDVFYGGNLGDGFKSVSFNFIFSGERTFTDDEINENMALITNLVNAKFGSRLR